MLKQEQKKRGEKAMVEMLRCTTCGKIMRGSGKKICLLALDQLHGEPLNSPFCSVDCAETERQKRIGLLLDKVEEIRHLPIKFTTLE